MKVWMLFSSIFFIILVLLFGIILSNNITNFNEYIIFWLLYLTTITTIGILLAGFYMSMTLKDLKGKPGPRGETGDIGEDGMAGLCEEGCRNNICYNIIIKAVSRRLSQLEDYRKRGINLDDKKLQNEMKTIDYIIYYDNMNFTISEIKAKLEEKLKDKKIKKNKYLELDAIREYLENDLKDGDFTITNVYIKEKIKSMCHSPQFKELSSVRGPQKLIEYLKDIWIKWVDSIYDASGVNYFLSVGAENDFEWVKDNPFNEIKKYDVFYWGLPRKARPYVLDVKNKYPVKIEFTDKKIANSKNSKNSKNNKKSKIKKGKKEGFANYEDLVHPKVKGMDRPTEKNKLKIVHSNDYYFTYDDRGTTMKQSVRAYRPHYKDHKGERYYPLGDVIVAPSKTHGDFGDKIVFGEYGEKRSFSKGRHIGPNRDTILVSGDVKKPIDYTPIWSDLQKAKERHWQCKICRKHKRYSHYKGVMYRVVCPKGYASLGDVFMSRANLSDKLSSKVGGDFKPKGEHQPVCIPIKCLETIDKSATKVWNSNLSQKGGTRVKDIYDYENDDTLIYSLNPSNINDTEFHEGTHKNAYNLAKVSRKVYAYDDLTTDDSTEQQKRVPYFYRIKEECIAKRGSVSLNGDDYQYPSIMKEDKQGINNKDKYGTIIEDNKAMFIDQLENEDNEDNKQHNNTDIMGIITRLESEFERNKEYSNKNLFLMNIVMKYNLKKLDDNYEFKLEDVLYLYSIGDFISFINSLPNITKYDKIKYLNGVLNESLRKVITPINNVEINKLKNKFGLGWIDITRADYGNEGNYSMHHFFYINNTGILSHKNNGNIKIRFNKVKQPSLYTLQNIETNEYYKIDSKGNKNSLVKTNVFNENDRTFQFILKLTGNNTNEVFIYVGGNSNVLERKVMYDSVLNGLKIIKDPLNAKVESTSFIIN